MKLAILNLTGGGISGGYKNYLQSMLPRLAADPRITSVLCVAPGSLGAEELATAGPKLRFVECAPFRPFHNGVDRAMEELLSSYAPDLIFVPTARVAKFRDVPVVSMIQNMAPLVSWEWYGPWQKLKLWVQRAETFRAVAQAEKIISISGFVHDFLRGAWAVPEAKIAPVYFGTPVPAANPRRPSNLPADWTSFLFTAGSVEPYRSLEDVIECAEYFRKDLGSPVKIVVAGRAKADMRRYEAHLKRMAEKAGVAADLCWAGQISAEEMTWCYRNCLAFLMTSRVEAGPTTVLESMSCGAVCVAADNPPLPEFYGAAAVYYTPGDGRMLAARIREVLAWEAGKLSVLSSAAHARSREFTWEKTVDKTIELFQEVLRNARAG
ncbi:MAG: glycosyltransferase [Elusimicrobia bacterium]|nr:glycosyltransferase [Elusimicrobiota bacterium]